jgi:hypothetical protein
MEKKLQNKNAAKPINKTQLKYEKKSYKEYFYEKKSSHKVNI